MARALLFVKDMFSFFQSKLMMIPLSRSVLQDRKSPLSATQTALSEAKPPRVTASQERLQCTSFTSTRLPPAGPWHLEPTMVHLPAVGGAAARGERTSQTPLAAARWMGQSSRMHRLQFHICRIDMVTLTPSKSPVNLLLASGM